MLQLINDIISGYTTKGSSMSIKSFQNRGFEKNKLRLAVVSKRSTPGIF